MGLGTPLPPDSGKNLTLSVHGTKIVSMSWHNKSVDANGTNVVSIPFPHPQVQVPSLSAPPPSLGQTKIQFNLS